MRFTESMPLRVEPESSTLGHQFVHALRIRAGVVVITMSMGISMSGVSCILKPGMVAQAENGQGQYDKNHGNRALQRLIL